jgi:endonuclease/exonuclease/phosphatase family metal-dependent hydrolase
MKIILGDVNTKPGTQDFFKLTNEEQELQKSSKKKMALKQ